MNKNYSIQKKHELLLKEYEEIGQWLRSDDALITQWTAILLPIALGILVLPFTFWEHRKIVNVILGIAAIPTMVFWLIYCNRISERSKLRLKRAKEIEEILRFNHYQQYDEHGARKGSITFKQMLIGVYSIYGLIWVILVFGP